MFARLPAHKSSMLRKQMASDGMTIAALLAYQKTPNRSPKRLDYLYNQTAISEAVDD
jgi:hypothetical protein